MVKNAKSKQFRRGLVIMLVSAIAVACFIFATLMLQKPANQDGQMPAPAEGAIWIKGTILCLPHKDTSGPQTLECAYGLKDERDRYFGLRDSDPGYKNISGVPMNKQVEVSGTFKKGTSSTYPTVGTIEVTKITH